MNGPDIFVDTNICIYLLNGDTALAELLQDQSLCISIITEIELYSYQHRNAAATQILDSFMQSISIIGIEETIKKNTIQIRKNAKLKLPDCIIAASAMTYNLPLITADQGFKKINRLDLILYEKN